MSQEIPWLILDIRVALPSHRRDRPPHRSPLLSEGGMAHRAGAVTQRRSLQLIRWPHFVVDVIQIPFRPESVYQ